MPIYIYSAADQDGKIVKGARDAENEKVLASTLKSEGLFLLDAREKGTGLKSLNFRIDLDELLSRIKPIGLVDKLFFTRNLAVMIGAGLSLPRALDGLAKETPNHKLRKIIADVNSAVVKGRNFAEALRGHRNVFGDLYINMIEVGETSGKLTLVLKLLAKQMKRDHDLRRRVKGALIYPSIIISALLGIGALMMIYVVPTLSGVLKDLDVPLPITTQIIIAISDFLLNYAAWALIGFILLVLLIWRALKSERGKIIFDHAVLRAPIFGKLIKKFNIARFCRTLAYLLTSGVPFVRSLEVTSSVLGNTRFQDAAKRASQEIQKGKQLHQVLELYPNIFDPVVIELISVGEETGKISDMMLRLAMFYEEDVASTTKNLSTVIEPLLMIVIGGAVGFFAISVLQPIYGSLGSI